LKPLYLIAALFVVLATTLPSPAGAQEAWAWESEWESEPKQLLERQATDPTASLASIQLHDWWAPSYHQVENASNNQLLLRGVLPFRTGPLSHLARASLAFYTGSPNGAGLSDLVLFDLVMFRWNSISWGVGPLLVFPTATRNELGTGKWSLGPAAAFVARAGRLQLGALSQNAFSLFGNNERNSFWQSQLQPIVNFALGHGWTVGTSEMNFVYDWWRGHFLDLPVGLKVVKVYHLGGLPFSLNAQAEYDLASPVPGPAWTLRLGVSLLFPMGEQDT
jgi:hypothetical protein